MSAYKITHSNQNSYQVRLENGLIYLNDELVEIDYSYIKDNEIHFIMKNHASITAKVLSQNIDTKQYVIEINGTHHTVKLEDKLDILMDKMGLKQRKNDAMGDVKAPMPGLVLRILVEKGQEVQKDEPMIVLEAMKMENVIKASGVGVVKNIPVEVQQAVEKNQILIEIV